MSNGDKSDLIRPIGKTVGQIFSESSAKVESEMDRLFVQLPAGQISTAIGDTFYGINHRQTPGAISINKDLYGLTFFTRPRLNLTSENVRAVRKLTGLLTNEQRSIQRIIRCLLCPDMGDPSRAEWAGITSPFVDRQQAFIPVLTNHLLSMQGWPDLQLPTHTSPDGVYHEAYSIVDGLSVNYSTYDITANFRNLPGDPITALFLVWLHYASNVYQGTMVPFPDMMVQNEVDYNTRIYRLVLDASKTRVQGIAACGAAFPWSAPTGMKFNFESGQPINRWDEQITINFRCMGAEYQDDILIDEFNRTVALFNGAMSPSNFNIRFGRGFGGETLVHTTHKQGYVQVPMDALSIFNNRGYSRIDPVSYELQWWVTAEDYAQRLPNYQDYQKLHAPPAVNRRGQ